jgi:hypothetical protein
MLGDFGREPPVFRNRFIRRQVPLAVPCGRP